jgi:superfamily II DNA/RNA helicase
MVQAAREKAMARFREGKIEILVATDVAARGIDVEGVTHVINYTCPEDEKNYVHRIGRTGRAGASGVAITFVDWPDVTRWKVINKALDLPYDEPEETYSTSEHLFHEQGIPPGALGRLKPASPAAPRSSPASGPGSGDSGRGGRRGSGATEPGRRRSRTRGGSAGAPDDASSGQGDAAQTASPAAAGSGKRRRRNRTRTRGGAPVSQPADG